MLIGREREQQLLMDAYKARNSEFVAIYGRRRVGKTYLVREVFGSKVTFSHAGLANADKKSQLEAWVDSMKEYGVEAPQFPKTWIEAFSILKDVVRKSKSRKKVLFIDEMPWMDTQHSGFVSALEHFWNGWASARKDVLLIVCGSATSWMVNHVIKNHGGLHNRVTVRIHVKPFSLHECEEYAKSRNLSMSRRLLMECYMIMGGVPFYWTFLRKGKSLAQNVDDIFFNTEGNLWGEFDELYASLFKNPDLYVKIVTILASKRVGMTRGELLKEGKITNSGNVTKALSDLENCGFIRRYSPLGRKERGAVYQLIDFYTLFYFKFIRANKNVDRHFWTLNQETPQYYAWSGLAFERLCFEHVEQIKAALGISGVMSSVYSWRSRTDLSDGRGAQIDMLIDRRDSVITLCEMKYSKNRFVIDADYDDVLMNKVERFRTETKTRKSVQIALVTTVGLVQNEYYDDVQNVVEMNNLFGL